MTPSWERKAVSFHNERSNRVCSSAFTCIQHDSMISLPHLARALISQHWILLSNFKIVRKEKTWAALGKHHQEI